VPSVAKLCPEKTYVVVRLHTSGPQRALVASVTEELNRQDKPYVQYVRPPTGGSRPCARIAVRSEYAPGSLMPISVLLADHTGVVRKAIRELLSSEPGIQVVGEAANFQETLKLIEALRPNVVVMDLHMPGEFTVSPSELKDRLYLDATSLVAISIWNDDESHALAESYGASRLLDKIGPSSTLVQAIVDLAPIAVEAQLARTASA